jgi:hypothetical protein
LRFERGRGDYGTADYELRVGDFLQKETEGTERLFNAEAQRCKGAERKRRRQPERSQLGRSAPKDGDGGESWGTNRVGLFRPAQELEMMQPLSGLPSFFLDGLPRVGSCLANPGLVCATPLGFSKTRRAVVSVRFPTPAPRSTGMETGESAIDGTVFSVL